ncbi:uncharacterized protein LOC129729156 [Wyeomyia smithii]|uniref:uncharacterized protein LOC129729156 n=1 Tax=Wyeomyia smithii TaxID=174621 RepID=UPI002467F218|nr:uncharacterized protein LOC129729156 [Wyeomyia smithii]
MLDLVKTGKATLQTAKAYIWSALVTKNEKLKDGNWECYKVIIGKKDEDINIGNIISGQVATTGDCVLAGGDEEEPPEEEQMWVLTLLMAPFRIHSGIRADYKKQLMARFKEILADYRVNTGPAWTLENFLSDKGQWEQDEGYSRLAAAVDMFYTKFSQSSWARLRLSTLSARYKNCAALTGIEYLRKVACSQIGELIMWVWTDEIAKDLKAVFKSGEELDSMDSYLPYIASMHLAKKSPYSASHYLKITRQIAAPPTLMAAPERKKRISKTSEITVDW